MISSGGVGLDSGSDEGIVRAGLVGVSQNCRWICGVENSTTAEIWIWPDTHKDARAEFMKPISGWRGWQLGLILGNNTGRNIQISPVFRVWLFPYICCFCIKFVNHVRPGWFLSLNSRVLFSIYPSTDWTEWRIESRKWLSLITYFEHPGPSFHQLSSRFAGQYKRWRE